MQIEAEIEFTELLIKQCDMLLDPRRPRHRPELAVPASRKKMDFLDELKRLKAKQPQPEQEAA